ncbi:MAG: hypothetical protein U0736_12955 [Gemmataceae bacterium]
MTRTVACSACGHSMRLNVHWTERAVSCPSCLRRFKPASPSAVPTPSANQIVSDLLLARLRGVTTVLASRRTLIGIGGGLLLVFVFGVAIGVAGARWSAGPAPAPTSLSDPTMSLVSFSGVSPPSPWKAIEPPIQLPRAPLLSLPSAAREVNSLSGAGRLPRHLAVVHDPHSNNLICSAREDYLHVCSADSFQPRLTHRLERTAYQLVVDPTRRLLYATLIPDDKLRLNALGDPSNLFADLPGELCVYDLNAVLRPGVEGRRLTPVRRMPIDGYLLSMSLTADGAYLVYLADNHRTAHVGRVSLTHWKQDHAFPLEKTGAISVSLARDELVAYVLAGATVVALDVATWQVRDQVAVTGSIQAALGSVNGRILLVERRPALQFHLLHLKSRQAIARWQLDVDGRPSFLISPRGDRLYVGTSAVTAGRVLAIDLPQGPVGQPVCVGHVRSNGQRLIRGPLMLTGDGRLLITGAGQVFRSVS